MNEDGNYEEVGLVKWRRKENWVVDDINSQRMVYEDSVQLHKANK